MPRHCHVPTAATRGGDPQQDMNTHFHITYYCLAVRPQFGHNCAPNKLTSHDAATSCHGPQMTYERITRGVRVRVWPTFLPDQSSPEENLWFWAYAVEITNESPEILQLRTRHWKITDANGRVQEVRGVGVVGQEPVLQPGETFQYTSGCPLTTPSGFMTGSYAMQAPDGSLMEVAIPAFALDIPAKRGPLN